MRILVIGKSGQLARALAHVPQQGAELAFLDRDQFDLLAPDRIDEAIATHTPEIVINAAAYTAVDQAETERDIAFQVNATAVGAIARATASAGAGLIHVSTDYVFDGQGAGAYRETDPVAPVNAYGASKLAGEQAALAGNSRCVVLRTSWVYAPWGRNFVTTMLRLANTHTHLRIVDDQRGKPTSALDLADACLSIAPRLAMAPTGDPVWGLYHYAGSGVCSWADLAAGVFQGTHPRLNTPGPEIERPEIERIGTADYPTPAKRPANSALDCSKFETEFSLRTAPWPQALDRVLGVLSSDYAPLSEA
jgi:dTDP-4-dehydrorhamnose reductase